MKTTAPDKNLISQRPLPMPRVYEQNGTVTLCFELGSVQSRMRKDDPEHLVLAYTQTMMSFLLLKPSPRNVAMIGLGGGSIAKWCYRELPHADITVVEINPHVIALRERFHIPEDNDRFRILCEDGAHFVARTSWLHDVLLVDGFGLDGQPPELCSQRFYDDCYQSLSATGLMVVNLCDDDLHPILERIRKSFRNQVLVVMPEDDGNIVIFACKGKRLWPEGVSGGSYLAQLRKIAAQKQREKAA